MRGSKDNVPRDLITEIFYLLPVMSLLRIKSVCKLWLSIISDPEFVKTHSYRTQVKSNLKASLLMLTCWQFNGPVQFFASQEFNSYQLESRGFQVIGSCNGIICLDDYKFFHLWNPATKQGKRLPVFPQIEQDFTGVYASVQQAFGLDTISDDYKILKFTCPTIKTNVVPVMQVYSTTTGSLKVIHVHDTSLLEVLCYPYLKLGPVIEGVLYMGRKGHLASFNLNSEMFSVVPFPSSLLRYSEVLDFEGSAAVICESFGEGSGISLWTLKKVGGEVSWTHKINVRDDIRWAYSYLGGGLLYGRSLNERVGVLHAYIKNKVNFPVKNFRAVLKYTESLVSIEGFEPVPRLVPWFSRRV